MAMAIIICCLFLYQMIKTITPTTMTTPITIPMIPPMVSGMLVEAVVLE